MRATTKRRPWRAGIVGAAALAAGGLAISAHGASAATVVADNGFRPQSDGFSFPNFGDRVIGVDEGRFVLTDEVAAGIGPAEMTQMFGRKVCSQAAGPCTLTPAANEWADEMNSAASGGHCYGFAVLASAGKAGTGWAPAPFGAPVVPALSIDGNRALQSQLTMGFAHQGLDAVIDKGGVGPPSAILEAVREALASGEQLLFGIYKRDRTGGHAITPYAIEDRGGNRFDVLVYDNNEPGLERRLTIDAGKDTWAYEASTNPTETSDLYEGDANTNTLYIYDPLAGFGSQNAFPTRQASGNANGARLSSAGGRQLLTWSGDHSDGEHGSLLVRDAAGNRAGCTHDGDGQSCINRIPGAQAQDVLAGGTTPWEDSPHPRYTLSANRTYQVALSGRGLAGPAREELSMIGDGYHVGVEHVDLKPGERRTVMFAPRGRGVEFRNGRAANDRVRLELSTGHGRTHYDFHMTTATIPARTKVGARLDRGARTLEITSSARRAVRARLGLERLRGASEAAVAPRWISIPDGGRALVRYGAWRFDDKLEVVIDPTPAKSGDERTVSLGRRS